jgi:hypothetical protein
MFIDRNRRVRMPPGATATDRTASLLLRAFIGKELSDHVLETGH